MLKHLLDFIAFRSKVEYCSVNIGSLNVDFEYKVNSKLNLLFM